MKLFKRIASAVGVALFWLLLWQIAAAAVGDPLILPSPIQTTARLCRLALTAPFWSFTALSLLRVLAGILCAVPAALLFSALCAWSGIADRLFAPAVTLMKSVPVVSFILIAIFIFERELIPSAITFMMVFPLLYENLREGIACTSPELLEMASVFELSPMTKVKRIYFPSVKPFFFSALSTSAGLGIKAGVAAEVVAYIPESIGKNLSDAKSYMEPADLLAWTAVTVALGILIEKLIRLALRRRADDRN